MIPVKIEQVELCNKLKSSVKEFLYGNSPLRNVFDVYPVENEIKIFKNVKYARYFKDGLVSDEIKEGNVFVPFFEVYRLYIDKIDFDLFNLHICEDMLLQETTLYNNLKEYLIRTRRGILLIKKDIEIVCANDNEYIGFAAFEQIGVIVLNSSATSKTFV